jgi:hypothetical protein
VVSFQSKYQILSPLNDGETQSFRAREVASGRTVLVHYLVTGRAAPGEPDLAFLIFKFLRSASAEEGRHLLDMGEDVGRIYVVTTDAVHCSDLRKWLRSVTEGPQENDKAAGAGEGSPLEAGHFDFTRTFTTEALRQFTNLLATSSAAKLGPDAAASSAKQLSGSPKLADTGAHDFTVFWDKYYPANGAAGSDSKPASSVSEQKPIEPANAPSPAVEPAKHPPTLTRHESDGADIASLLAQAAEQDRAHAPAVGMETAKGEEPAVPAPTAQPAANRPVSIDEVDISRPVTNVAKPASDPSTRIPQMLAELLKESGDAPAPAPGAEPHAKPEDVPPSGIAVAEQAARRPMPKGFEVVFQSDKPRSRPTLSGVFDTSAFAGASAAGAPPPGGSPAVNEKPLPPPAEVRSPILAKLVADSRAREATNPPTGTPRTPGEVKPAAGVGRATPPSPLPSPLVSSESEKPTRHVPAPPVPPPSPVPPSPPIFPAPEAKAESISPLPAPDGFGATQLFAAPKVPPAQLELPSPKGLTPPVPTQRAQPGEYTRMVENIRALAGPLPPLGAPESAPSTSLRDGNPAVPAPLSAQTSLSSVPLAQTTGTLTPPAKLQPAVYIVNDAPAYPAGRKRKVWVPIVILSGLFLMTLGLLLFFSFKH